MISNRTSYHWNSTNNLRAQTFRSTAKSFCPPLITGYNQGRYDAKSVENFGNIHLMTNRLVFCSPNHTHRKKSSITEIQQQRKEQLEKICVKSKGLSYKNKQNSEINLKKYINNYIENAFIKLEARKNVEKDKKMSEVTLNLYERIGQDKIKILVTNMYEDALIDPILQQKFISINKESLIKMMITFICFILGKNTFYDIQNMEKAHRNIGITSEQFSQMKILLFKHFLQQYIPIQITLQTMQLINQYKPAIKGKNSEVIQEQQTQYLKKISQCTYQNIQNDINLSKYFQRVDYHMQAIKFENMFTSSLQFNKDTNFTLEKLRYKHLKLQLSENDYIIFKLHVHHSLQQHQTSNKKMSNILQKINAYKYSVLNIDSPFNYILKNGGVGKFSDNFIIQLKQFRASRKYLEKLGIKKVKDHIKLMLTYMFNQQIDSISYKELKQIHNQVLTKDLFDLFRQITIQLFYSVDSPQYIINDVIDVFKVLELNLLREPLQDDCFNSQQFSFNLATLMSKDERIQQMFINSTINISFHVKQIIPQLIQDDPPYTLNDMIILHKNLNIDQDLYNVFRERIILQLIEDKVDQKVLERIQDKLDLNGAICSKQ